MGIAEQGKVFALAGDHKQALRHYREAMRQTASAGDPEVFFRHYLECTIESLELMGAYGDVLDYCQKALDFFSGLNTDQRQTEAVQLNLAHVHQRRGAVLMKMGQRAEARAAFAEALAIMPQLQPARTFAGWIERNLHVDAARVLAEQRRHGCFSVRPETVDPSRAVALSVP